MLRCACRYQQIPAQHNIYINKSTSARALMSARLPSCPQNDGCHPCAVDVVCQPLLEVWVCQVVNLQTIPLEHKRTSTAKIRHRRCTGCRLCPRPCHNRSRSCPYPCHILSLTLVSPPLPQRCRACATAGSSPFSCKQWQEHVEIATYARTSSCCCCCCCAVLCCR